MNRRALTLLSALLAGCTVGPNYARPDTPVPPSYAEPHAAAGLSDGDLASWWTAFGDPELDKLVNRAIARNLDVETAAARISEARAQERVAGTAALPEVSANSSVTHERISEHAIPVPPGPGGGGTGTGFGLPGSEFTTFRVGFDASWELDLFGRNSSGNRSGKGPDRRCDLEQARRRGSTAAEVASSYLTLRSLQQQISIAQAEVERQQRSLHLVGARVRGGLVTGQDLEQQNSELSAAEAAIPPLRAQVRSANP